MTDTPTTETAAEIHALRCADCARADSADHSARPVDMLPIPVDALAGFPDGVPQTKGYNRRQFLRNGVVGFASVYAAHALNWTSVFEAAVAEAAVGPQNQLVMLYLNGGMDGLNCRRPRFDRQLQRLPGPRDRRSIATSTFRRSPAASAPRWRRVPAGRSPSPTRWSLVPATTATRRGSTLCGATAPAAPARTSLTCRACTSCPPTARTSTRRTTSSPALCRSWARAGSAAGSTCTARRRTRCRPSRSARRCPRPSAPRRRPSARCRRTSRNFGFTVNECERQRRGRPPRSDPGIDGSG